MLIVLDTNVLISSQLTRQGNAASILQYHRLGIFDIAVSEPIFEDYTRVFQYPHLQARHKWSSEQVSKFFTDLRKVFIFVEVDNTPRISTDPHDDKFFHCAQAAGADYLVSGDERHVLPITSYQTTQVISPKDFVDLIEHEQYAA